MMPGNVTFYTYRRRSPDQKVVIEVNVDAANKQSIRFSAKLLRIAEIKGD
ncbi:MAG: hypothetical protein P8Y28_00215 [Gammaproteobacteria bacterium]